MTKYREILRLKSLGFSERNIALSVPCSRNTVSKVIKLANAMNISWPLPEGTTDADLEKQFKSPASTTTAKRMPDYDYIRKELLKNGVTKKLLWTEYMEECRQSGDKPLMYSQFCYHIQQDENKHRATIEKKCTLTIKEASAYSGIGVNKIREISKSPLCDFTLYVRLSENSLQGKLIPTLPDNLA